MPRQAKMTWNRKQKRWFKKANNKQFVVSCRVLSKEFPELFVSATEEGSYRAANAWWDSRADDQQKELAKRMTSVCLESLRKSVVDRNKKSDDNRQREEAMTEIYRQAGDGEISMTAAVAMNLSRGHGSSIHEVSGSGSPRASRTVSHPSRKVIQRSLPLLATHRSSPHPSQAVAKSNVVRTSCPTYRSTSSRFPSAQSEGASLPFMPSGFPATPMPLAAASRETPCPRRQRTWNIMSTCASQSAAGFKQPRLLRKDVEVESDAVPGDEGVAVFDLGCQVIDQLDSFFSAHPVCRARAVIAAVPEPWLVGVGEEGRRAGDPQGAAGSPVPVGQSRRFDVESQVRACRAHHS